LLLVTHDRRMLETVSVTRRVAVAGGQITEALSRTDAWLRPGPPTST
jgi:ATPase subunit of ABC transporter with duplicated ATPase domains